MRKFLEGRWPRFRHWFVKPHLSSYSEDKSIREKTDIVRRCAPGTKMCGHRQPQRARFSALPNCIFTDASNLARCSAEIFLRSSSPHDLVATIMLRLSECCFNLGSFSATILAVFPSTVTPGMSAGFLEHLATQLKANKNPACRRAIERILATLKKKYEEGKFASTTEAEAEFRSLVEHQKSCRKSSA